MKKTRYTSDSKVKEALLKMKGLFSSKPSCLHVEINGKRISGSEMKDCEISEDGLKFTYGGNDYDFSLAEIYMMKRLRTRRYCFFCKKAEKKAKKAEKVEKKEEEKPQKKTKKKATKKKSE